MSDERVRPPASDRRAATRERIIEASLETVRRDGFIEATARGIAATGRFNQALIFYHFGSLKALLDEGFHQASEHQVARCREAVQQLDGLTDLVAIASGRCQQDGPRVPHCYYQLIEV